MKFCSALCISLPICFSGFATHKSSHCVLNEKRKEKLIYPCKECEKVYKTKKHLSWHVNSIHLKVEKTHLCKHCGKFFLDELLLKGRVNEETEFWHF